MSFSERKIIDKIEIVETNHVQVRERTDILKNDQVISSTYHRWCIMPGQDYSSYDSKVQNICKLVHTQDVIDEYLSNFQSSLLPTSPAPESMPEPENPM